MLLKNWGKSTNWQKSRYLNYRIIILYNGILLMLNITEHNNPSLLMNVTNITVNYGSQTPSIELIFGGGEGVKSYMQVFNSMGGMGVGTPNSYVVQRSTIYIYMKTKPVNTNL